MVVEGVVAHRRVAASTRAEFGPAFDAAMQGWPERGALVEAPIPEGSATSRWWSWMARALRSRTVPSAAHHEVYVTRVDPAPRHERLSKAALAALAGAIVHRLGPLACAYDRNRLERFEPPAPRRNGHVVAERPV